MRVRSTYKFSTFLCNTGRCPVRARPWGPPGAHCVGRGPWVVAVVPAATTLSVSSVEYPLTRACSASCSESTLIFTETLDVIGRISYFMVWTLKSREIEVIALVRCGARITVHFCLQGLHSGNLPGAQRNHRCLGFSSLFRAADAILGLHLAGLPTSGVVVEAPRLGLDLVHSVMGSRFTEGES